MQEKEALALLIADMIGLNAYLAEVQERRELRVACELTPALSARMTDAALAEALVIGLPMAQGIERRIVRSRGRGVVMTAKLHYRDGVRLLDHHRNGRAMLSPQEAAAIDAARVIAAEAICQQDEEGCFQYLYDWVCRSIRYVHTAPGKKGYERLVGASSVLADGQANCQGFADVLYLLCGLCGIEAAYRCGRGVRQLHVWNAVNLCGEWFEADVSRAARGFND